MNQIGFKNFRKFESLEYQNFGDITILVGSNNAGKSTLVKGLLLILDNLKNFGQTKYLTNVQKPEFRFDANEYHDLGIGTFGRALYNHSTRDEIVFSLRLTRELASDSLQSDGKKRKADFSFHIFVVGDKNTDQTTGSISRMLIEDHQRGVNFEFNYNVGTSVIEFRPSKSVNTDMRRGLEDRIEQLEKELKQTYDKSRMLKTTLSVKKEEFNESVNIENAAEHSFLVQCKTELENRVALLFSRMDKLEQNSEEYNETNAEVEQLQKKLARTEEQIAHNQIIINKKEVDRLESLNSSALLKISELNAELDKLRKSYDILMKDDSTTEQPARVQVDNSQFSWDLGDGFFTTQIFNFIMYASGTESISDENREDAEKFDAWQKRESDKSFIHERDSLLYALEEDLQQIVGGISAEYIYAHSASQNIFYNTADKNDYMAKAIHRYYREKIVAGSTPHTFVKTWMKKFGIGDDFEIVSFGGEAYRFYIYEGKDRMDLADKGMGSNQLMILLISLASMIRRYEHTYAKPFVIIEEPEQNLHPALQSRLIELITEVNKKYGFQFIIETHSEYIVRRAQVFVAQGGYKDDKDAMNNSPYAVYYFPQEGEPYLMQFRQDGKFSNEFGPGFYDEANNLVFEIL